VQGNSYTTDEISLNPSSPLAQVLHGANSSKSSAALLVADVPSLLLAFMSAPGPMQIVFPIVYVIYIFV
jgi:hypothetical protein